MLSWVKVADPDELPEGRVKTVTAGHLSIALTHYDGQFGALDNHCPHQGGPLGEGTIEGGLLRCPWHGYDYCPIDGTAPGEFGDNVGTYPLEIRDDGIYVGLEPDQPHVRTVTDVMAETMVNWGVKHVFGMVGHSNLGLAEDADRDQVRSPGPDAGLSGAGVGQPDLGVPGAGACAAATALGCSGARRRRALAGGARGLRIGVPREFFNEGVDPDVDRSVRAAIAVLRELGATIEDVSLPHTDLGIAATSFAPAPASASPAATT